MKTYSIKDISTILGVTRVTVYRYIKKYRRNLGVNLRETDKGLRLNETGKNILVSLVTPSCNTSNTPFTSCDTADARLINEYKERIQQQDVTITQLQQDLRDITRLQGEERHRTDTILMKMTTEISGLQKALEYQKQDESVLQEASDKQHKKEKALLKQEIEKSREETEILKGKLFGLEVRHSQTTDKLKEGQDTLIRYLQEMQAMTTRQARPWYKKLWSWLNQPITWRGKEVSVEIGRDPGQEKKKNTGLRPITEARAA